MNTVSRNRLTAGLGLSAVLLAGIVVTAQVFASKPAVTPVPVADALPANPATVADAGTITMHDWTETRRSGTTLRP